MAGSVRANIRLLIREINKIVSAPYAVLFKTLSTILANTTDGEVYLWTVVKSCQIDALVLRLLEGLDYDAAALAVFLKLVRNSTIRDGVMRQNPGMMKSLFCVDADDSIFEAAIAVCRFPFPDDFAPPPEYFGFVDAILINRRAESLDIWIARLLDLLSTIPTVTLSTIDDATIQKCATMWNESSKAVSNITFIRFLSVAANLHRRYQSDESNLSCDVSIAAQPDPLAIWTAKCARLFTGEKAQKIIRPLLLRALYFVSNPSTEHDEQAPMCLNMIREVLDGIDVIALRTAMSDQETVNIFVKLAQKSTQNSIQTRWRLCTAGILLALDPECRLWDVTWLHSSLEFYMQEVLEISSISKSDITANHVNNLYFQHENCGLFEVVTQQCLKESSILATLMQHLIDWCRPSMYKTVKVTCSLHLASLFANSLSRFVATIKPDKDQLHSIGAANIPDWWSWNFTSLDRTLSCVGLEVCHHSVDFLQKEIASSISSAVLRSSCTSGARIDTDKYEVLCEVICRVEQKGPKANCIKPRAAIQQGQSQPSFDTHMAENLPGYSLSLEEILSSMHERASMDVRKYIDNICRNLQNRCQEIEAPLRAERAKVAAVENELADLQDAKDAAIADLQARKLSWQHRFEVEQQEVAALNDRRLTLEQSLQDTNQLLRDKEQRILSMEEAKDELTRSHDALKLELEQERSQIQACKAECEQMANEICSLRNQLLSAQSKEEKLLCVLRGATEVM